MNTKSFGLDIGATSIKAVSLQSQKNGFLLDSSFMMPIPLKGMLSSSPLDEQEMAEALKKVVDNAKITTKNVNIALPENKIYTSVIEMPLLSDKELASAIYWEAEQYIPVPLSQINLVWTILKKDEKVRVLMVGAPTTVINKYQRILEMAGFKIAAIETEILSAIRALVYNKGSGNFPHTVITNIGAENTSLAIIKEGLLIFTYSIPTGGAAINRALEADFGLSQSASEEYKKVYGISKEGVGGKIGSAIEPILTSILNEFKKALAFYSQKYKDTPLIQQIVLSGGTARLPGIQLFFADALGIETAIANPWGALTNQNLPKEILDSASEYTIAVGLAMRGYE
jgi:type IV pilus assembly protein PilM